MKGSGQKPQASFLSRLNEARRGLVRNGLTVRVVMAARRLEKGFCISILEASPSGKPLKNGLGAEVVLDHYPTAEELRYTLEWQLRNDLGPTRAGSLAEGLIREGAMSHAEALEHLDLETLVAEWSTRGFPRAPEESPAPVYAAVRQVLRGRLARETGGSEAESARWARRILRALDEIVGHSVDTPFQEALLDWLEHDCAGWLEQEQGNRSGVFWTLVGLSAIQREHSRVYGLTDADCRACDARDGAFIARVAREPALSGLKAVLLDPQDFLGEAICDRLLEAAGEPPLKGLLARIEACRALDAAGPCEREPLL
jgi:hypothetical protein